MLILVEVFLLQLGMLLLLQGRAGSGQGACGCRGRRFSSASASPRWSMLAAALFGATLGGFIVAGIYHIGLLMFGGANAGFEATYRVVAFGTGSVYMLVPIPLVGPFFALVMYFVVLIYGLLYAHETTGGRAALAVFVPFFLATCCMCPLLLLFSSSLLVASCHRWDADRWRSNSAARSATSCSASADASAGKNARCPKCQTLMTVPAADGSAAPAAPPFPPPEGAFAWPPGAGPAPPFSPPAPPPPKDPFAPEGGSVPPPPKPTNPFSEQQAGSPFGGPAIGSLNPYASPPAAAGYQPPSWERTGLPWENEKKSIGCWFRTFGIVLGSPSRAFSIMKQTGGLGAPDSLQHAGLGWAGVFAVADRGSHHLDLCGWRRGRGQRRGRCRGGHRHRTGNDGGNRRLPGPVCCVRGHDRQLHRRRLVASVPDAVRRVRGRATRRRFA